MYNLSSFTLCFVLLAPFRPLQITVTAGLISHRVPCFGFVVQEVDKAGPLLEEECKKRGLHFSLFPDLKVKFSEPAPVIHTRT
jgi:hypothetical protein